MVQSLEKNEIIAFLKGGKVVGVSVRPLIPHEKKKTDFSSDGVIECKKKLDRCPSLVKR